MHRVPVTSSNLRSVGYDPKTQTLQIEFLKSGVYEYSGVPQSVYDGLMSAGSHGTYFDQFIKNAGYSYRKL